MNWAEPTKVSDYIPDPCTLDPMARIHGKQWVHLVNQAAPSGSWAGCWLLSYVTESTITAFVSIDHLCFPLSQRFYRAVLLKRKEGVKLECKECHWVAPRQERSESLCCEWTIISAVYNRPLHSATINPIIQKNNVIQKRSFQDPNMIACNHACVPYSAHHIWSSL